MVLLAVESMQTPTETDEAIRNNSSSKYCYAVAIILITFLNYTPTVGMLC